MYENIVQKDMNKFVMYKTEFLPIMLRIYFKSRTVIDIISPSVSHFLSHQVWHRHGLVMKV